MDTTIKVLIPNLFIRETYEDVYGAAVMPIYQTSTLLFPDADHGANLFAGKEKGYIYTRIGNPTIETLEKKLADLENGIGGVVFSSGMGLLALCMQPF